MTRKERQKQFKNIDEWLIHKANLRRKNEEEDRKRVAGKLDSEFKAEESGNELAWENWSG